MPRPKRTKVAPSAPAPRLRNAPDDSTAANIVSQVPKEPFDDLYDVSDPEDRARTNAQQMNRSNSKSKTAETPLKRAAGMSKSKSNSRESHREGKGTPLKHSDGNIHAESGADLIDSIEDGSSPEVEVGRRERNTPGIESSVFGFSNFRRRARQRSILGRAGGRGRSSSVESNLAEENGLTSIGRMNTSILATGNIRRPRQPSVMGRNQAGIAPSNMGLEMDRGTPAVGSALKLGNFRRRPRQSSILGTAQKPRAHQSDFDDDDEDDFNPDDESTPLNLSKVRTTPSTGPNSNPRKRKLSSVQVSRSQSSPPLHSPANDEAEETIPGTGPLSDVEDEHPAPSSPQEDPRPSIEAQSATPEPMSETMAPPHSSSSAPSSPEPAFPAPRARGRPPSRGRNGRTPPPRTQDSPVSSPPSLTHSPNRSYISKNQPKARKVLPPPSTYSTAQLQNLLPRRRRRTARDPFDIPSSDGEIDTSGLASDDDELSHLNIRGRRQRSVFSRTPGPSKKAPKSKPVPKSTGKGIKRTYGARTTATSDKENEEHDPDDSLAPIQDDGNESPENSQELEKRVGKELKKAARKFQEVDKWELEFEDVTPDTSSPMEAR
ncbi:hypothetical protein G7Y89_g722 [Cudoniella acicularis]|uniref:Uncharacterized protein n=1 Tax=Cudoniella acicularis TaxID=354080 RepID=A0A8H4RYB4_9HELO|nr:hypothetical protein G7Y89_g722 [Cudoniella acicularis]